MCAMASAVEVAEFQYGTQPVTSKVLVAANANTGTAKAPMNNAVRSIRRERIGVEYIKETHGAAKYFTVNYTFSALNRAMRPFFRTTRYTIMKNKYESNRYTSESTMPSIMVENDAPVPS